MRKEKGQVLIELALVLPILLLVVMGIVDFDRAMYTKNTLNNAARSGARTAAVTPSLMAESGSLASPGTPIANTIKNNLFNGIQASQVTTASSYWTPLPPLRWRDRPWPAIRSGSRSPGRISR